MSSVTTRERELEIRPLVAVPPARPDWVDRHRPLGITLVAVALPIATAAILIPWRQSLDTADCALFLVVAIVAVASTGRRLAAAVAAVVASLSFDFFLTRPYNSFRIERRQDLITEILLLVVGITVGELATRGRTHRDAASESRHLMALLHSVTELAASGQDPYLVIDAATDELGEVLGLRDCRFAPHDPGGISARVTPDGEVTVGKEVWSTADLGLPTRTVDLPVRGAGWVLGHFLLTPTPGRQVTQAQLRVAVAIADQVGAALAGDSH